MVAKINKGESLFAALAYNQTKVGEGAARVIGSNRMVGDVANIPDSAMQRMMLSFENYLVANRRTEKPILHISLNPSPDDRLTDGQFASLAADYMTQMGYGDQPYVVFMHEDTGRRHIHIVSTCVDENGRKIKSDYEWRRSMVACRELEEKYGLVNSADSKLRQTEPYLKKVDYRQGDLKHQISNTLKSVLAGYKFQTFGEYSALLACYKIEAKQVKGEYEGVPYAGIVYAATDERDNAVGPPFKSSLFGKQFGYDALTKKMIRHTQAFRQKKWEPKIHDAVRLAMITCQGNRERFEKTLHGKGIDAVFRTNDEGRIYGTTFVDHNAREVYNGSRLGKEFSANAFERLFNDPAALSALSQVPHPDLGAGRHASHDQSSSIEAAFGMLDLSPDGPVRDYEEEAFARRMKRKKKKQGRYISK